MGNIVDAISLGTKESDVYIEQDTVCEVFKLCSSEIDTVRNIGKIVCNNGLEIDTESMKDEDASEICKPDYTYVLYNRINHNLFLAKDTDGYDLDPIRLWYSSDYISLPIYRDDCMTVEAIAEMCKRAEKLLKSDMKIGASENSCHIALTKSISNNTFLGWFVEEEKYVAVTDYKEYRDHFIFSNSEGNEITLARISEGYQVIKPSDELIRMLHLELFPVFWKYKSSEDSWEPRERWERIEVEDRYKDIYENAVRKINAGRIYDYGQDRLFHELEISTEHFEKMYKVVKVEAILCGCLARMKEKSEKIELRL